MNRDQTQAFDALVLSELRELGRPVAAVVATRALAARGVACGVHDVRLAFLRLADARRVRPIREFGDLVPRFGVAPPSALPN